MKMVTNPIPTIKDTTITKLTHQTSIENISTMFFQIQLPQDSMIEGQNRGHVISRAKRVQYKAEII